MSLTEFLLARIADDETVARACKPVLSVSDDGYGFYSITADDDPRVPGYWDSVANDVQEPYLAHIFRWDPARVLAECEAKRRIVAVHIAQTMPPAWGYAERCTLCSDSDYGDEAYPCETIRALAAAYTDHPEYDPAWKITPV